MTGAQCQRPGLKHTVHSLDYCDEAVKVARELTTPADGFLPPDIAQGGRLAERTYLTDSAKSFARFASPACETWPLTAEWKAVMAFRGDRGVGVGLSRTKQGEYCRGKNLLPFSVFT
jgi:hypothetical protein